MGSGPVGGLCYRSCMSGESGIHQKAKGIHLCSMRYSTGHGHSFHVELWMVGASQRMMVKTRGSW